MSNETLPMTPELVSYLRQVAVRDDPALADLRAETAGMEDHQMQIAPEQGQFMAFMASALRVRRAIEIGTFTGYSALCVARALPADGRLVCLDINPETTAVARRHWQAAGVADRIDLRLGAAADTLQALLADPGPDSFDMAFIDADKPAYDGYYEMCLQLVRPGGVILIDNVLWGGDVADPGKEDRFTTALRALNAKVHADDRVDMCLLPVADGILMARRRR